MAHPVIAAGQPGAIEVGVDLEIAQKLAHGPAGCRQIGPARVDAVVAASRIVVAEGDDHRAAGDGAAEHPRDEVGGRDGEGLNERRALVDTECLRRLGLELMGQEVAGEDGEIGFGSGSAQGRQRGVQKWEIGVLAEARHHLIGRARKPVAPPVDIQGRSASAIPGVANGSRK